jgi:DNA/RNA endonuclease G (NUC1)
LRKRREAMPKKEKKERVFIKREKTEEEKAAIKAKNSKRNKEYAKKNRKRLSEKHLERYRNNLSFKMASVLRCRVRKAIKQAKGIKFEKMKDIIGCDFKFFIDYIVSKFKPGMTLELLKSGKIHLDHIKPCAMFDLSKKEDQKACFHYTNIKPEWPEINFSKGARYVG